MQLQTIQSKIYEVRGHKVMIDFDLAQLYETETKVLKQAVRRNMDRFPSDFMFELTKEEYDSLRVQGIANYDDESLRSQIVTLEIGTLETGRGKCTPTSNPGFQAGEGSCIDDKGFSHAF